MTTFSHQGLTRGGRIGPQCLGHYGPLFVLDHSGVAREYDPATKLWVCPLDHVYTEPRNPIIVFGEPNVSIVLPNVSGDGWDRFAAFMFWRQRSYVTDTKRRVQAGVFYEIIGLPDGALDSLRRAISALIGTRKASCAHSVALALHRAGFTTNGGKSLRWIYRPTRLASILWRGGLEYQSQPVELRIIQTNRSVHDHFVATWKREYTSTGRLYKKYLARRPHGSAPVFDPAEESIEMSGDPWQSGGPRVSIGVGVPSDLGVNLGFVFGEQPEFTVTLPSSLDDTWLAEPLKPFPGKLSRVTKLKKYILFSRPVIWFLRKNLAARIVWIDDVPVRAAATMLRRSPGPERQGAFVYNFVLTGTELRLKRLQNDNGHDQKIINWLLAKHVLLSGYSRDVRLAGEVWCYEDTLGNVTICLSGDSGTYKPAPERGEAAAELLREMFETSIELVPRQAR